MNLPGELIKQVVNYLVREKDIAAAALVNIDWNSFSTPVLYRHVEIAEPIYGAEEYGPDFPRMAGLISTLNRNRYLSSLVHSITHEFFIGSSAEIMRGLPLWEIPLRNMRLQLQEIVDRNGFLRVTKLFLSHPDVEIANLLLKGLFPQLELLHISSAFSRHLPFRWLAGLPSKLGELDMKFHYELHVPNEIRYGDNWNAVRLEYYRADSVMLKDVNAFLASSVSLRTLRITTAEELGLRFQTLLEGVTLPGLHTLDTDLISRTPECRRGIAACLASFLNRNLSISRLVVHKLPQVDYTETLFSIAPAASAGIHELISCTLNVSDSYLAFLRLFTHFRTFKLERHTIAGKILLPRLLEVIRHLHRDQSGVKRLVLPMPSEISGLNPAGSEIDLARDSISDFGTVFKDYLPEVEVFCINQVGKFMELGAAEWARALAGHPCLKKLAIRTPFLSNSGVGSKTRQEAIDEIAQEFSALPQLEQLVFPEETGPRKHAIQVLIVRNELGVSGKAAFMDCSMVDKVFSDPTFRCTWR